MTALVTRSPETFAACKRAALDTKMEIARLSDQVILETLDNCSAPQAAVVSGIMTDKALAIAETISEESAPVDPLLLSKTASGIDRLSSELDTIKARIRSMSPLPVVVSPAPE